MRKRLIIFIAISILWILSLISLYRKEISPTKRINYAYRKLIPADLVFREEWFGIYFNRNKIGYANFVLGLDNTGKRKGYKISGESFLILPILGENQRLWLRVESHLDSECKLKSFYLSFFPGKIKTEIRGERKGESKFCVEVKEGKKISRNVIVLPQGTVLETFFGPPLGLTELQPGKIMKFSTLNPLTLSLEEVYLEVGDKQSIEISGKNYQAYLIKAKFSGLESQAWVDEKGQLLKEETPLGLVVIKESQNKALSFLAERREFGVDLAEFFSLPSNIELDPSKISKLYVVLRGRDLEPENLSQGRQVVLNTRTNSGIKEVYLVINKQSKKEKLISYKDYLESDSFIQADDSRIKAIAEFLIKDEKADFTKVKKILNWVYNYLEKKPTLSIPSALTALTLRQGDCNEHAFLFVALARSADIPAKIDNGLVYLKGRFYYHSWASVYVDDRWIDVDPTFNQLPADVTHILLREGELPQQIGLVKDLGKIEIEVKKYE